MKSCLYTLIACLLLNLPAYGEKVSADNVEAELLSELQAIEPGQDFYVLLKQDIRPGWHTYWRNPGDSGAPTRLAWQLPDGFSAGEIEWPYPDRVPYGPLMNFGYHDQVLFPVRISVPATIAADQLTLRAKGQWLVCADICIPEDAELSLQLPVGEGLKDPANTRLFEAAREKLARDIGVESSYQVQEDSLTLSVKMDGLRRARVESVDYYPYETGVMDNPVPQDFELTDSGFTLQTRVGYDYTPESSFNGIIVIEEDSGEQLATAFRIEPVGLAGSADSDGMSLQLAMLFALLGGLILNLMPCVFPVLSIKILSLVQQTDHVKTHGWVYLAGVVFSFVAIAFALIGLRAGGAQIGWGFQLQSPLIVALLAYLFLLIALNLSGYFEIGTRVMNLGSGLSGLEGYGGSFFTGVLATVVAAPCTAPFMASAIGYALTQSNVDALIIFACMGVGMAAPYVLLSHAPALLNRLPRPGAWMEKLKELLAFPLYGSAIWLLWVISLQTGSAGVLAVGAGALGLVFAIWLLKNLPAGPAVKRVSQLLALLLIIGAVYSPNSLTSTTATPAQATARSGYQGPAFEGYSEQRLAQLRTEGPVFVNFTAAWCITCKVNEAVALDSTLIRQAFADHGVNYLKGDWTNEDPVISRKLEEYGRSGVPLYLMYSRNSSRAAVLPQLLTEDIVLDALESL